MASDSEDESSNSDGSSAVGEEHSGRSGEDSDESGHDESSVEDSHYDDDDDDEESSSASIAGNNSRPDRSSEEDHVPVGLKLQRQRDAGVDMTVSRKRKAEAKGIASHRLATLKNKAVKKKDGRCDDERDDEALKRKRAKKSKHAPAEVSSKRSDFFQRQRRSNLNEAGLGVTLAAGYKPKDPRLSSLTGNLDVEKFERNYAFLAEMRDKEIAKLKQRIQAHRTTGSKGRHLRRRLGMGTNPTTLEEDRAELKRLEQEKGDQERQQIDRAAKVAVKRRMHEQVEQGRRPHFVSRAKQKQLVLEAKYEELRKRKGDKAVEKAIAKRLKKDKSKLLLPKAHA